MLSVVGNRSEYTMWSKITEITTIIFKSFIYLYMIYKYITIISSITNTVPLPNSTAHTDYSKHISNIRDKDGEHQHHAQDY